MRLGSSALLLPLVATSAITWSAASQGDAPPLADECRALLQRGLSVGVVLADVSQLHMVPPVQTPPADLEEQDDATFIEGMGRRWGALFEVTESRRGVDVVSRDATRCREALARAVAAGSFDGTPIEILFQLAARLDPSLEGLPPPGVVAAGPPGAMELLGTDVLMQPLSVDTREGSLSEALTEIVLAAPALGWFVAERCGAGAECRCELGLLTPNAIAFPGYDASAGLPLEER